MLKDEDSLQDLYTSEGIKTGKSYDLYKKGMQDFLNNQEAIERFARTLTEDQRVKHRQFIENQQILLMTCFCGEPNKPQNEILMWAHYTKNKTGSHTGMRIAFDSEYFKISGISTRKINYKTKRVLFNLLHHFQDKEKEMKEALDKSLEEKSMVWSYENEYRLFISPELCSEEKGNMFFTIKPNAILGIDFGIRCEMENSAMIDLVRNNLGEKVWIRKAKTDDYEFKIQYVDVK